MTTKKKTQKRTKAPGTTTIMSPVLRAGLLQHMEAVRQAEIRLQCARANYDVALADAMTTVGASVLRDVVCLDCGRIRRQGTKCPCDDG